MLGLRRARRRAARTLHDAQHVRHIESVHNRHELALDDAKLDAKPRDLFTEAKFRQFECDWGDKTETAFFRGTATGGGVTCETNQRLNLVRLAHEWRKAAGAGSGAGAAAARGGAAAAAPPPLLDAEITKFNWRDKKLAATPMTHLSAADFAFSAGKENFVPIFQQSRYKYLVYVEGHCAACRYGFMMRLGSVILKVESSCVADQLWFFPLLRPYVDHVPVRADLSETSRDIISMQQVLGYLEESLLDVKVPDKPTDLAGKRLYTILALDEMKQ